MIFKESPPALSEEQHPRKLRKDGKGARNCFRFAGASVNLTGKLGGKLPPSSVEGMTLRVTAGNMAAALGRLLSFSKNARVLRSTLTPVHRYSVEVSSAGEPITHTGQVFDVNDPRRARFVGRQKEVNKNFAIKLVAEEPVAEVGVRVVSCDGGGGALGHPKVYINLDKDTKVGTCGYCGLQFKQKH